MFSLGCARRCCIRIKESHALLSPGQVPRVSTDSLAALSITIVSMCATAMKSECRYGLPTDYEDQPISRTYQYRKVMKPMLERKRRARINRCLDELKELMVAALQAEGENVSKLEKADILELTVSHLHKLRRQHALTLTPEHSYTDRFRAGFTQCAAEVSTYFATVPAAANVDPASTAKLLQHLGTCIRTLDATSAATPAPASSESQYTPPSSPNMIARIPQSTTIRKVEDPSVWRPW